MEILALLSTGNEEGALSYIAARKDDAQSLVSTHDQEGTTALHCASQRGLEKATIELLAIGADPMARLKGEVHGNPGLRIGVRRHPPGPRDSVSQLDCAHCRPRSTLSCSYTDAACTCRHPQHPPAPRCVQWAHGLHQGAGQGPAPDGQAPHRDLRLPEPARGQPPDDGGYPRAPGCRSRTAKLPCGPLPPER